MPRIPFIEAVPTRVDYNLPLGSTPSLNRRYGTGTAFDFIGPTASSGLLVWQGNGTGGTRECYWPTSLGSTLRDAEVRSRWVYRNNAQGQNQAIEVQHGHAHRIIDIDGTQASFLSITRNIFNANGQTGANMNLINFHWWDQGTQQSQPPYNETGVQQFHQFGSVLLDRLLGAANSSVDFPWNVKSRVVDKFFEFVIWLDTDTEPDYGAKDGNGKPFGGGLEIPSVSLNYGVGGAHGVYMGHNLDGSSSASTNIQVRKYP